MMMFYGNEVNDYCIFFEYVFFCNGFKLIFVWIIKEDI